MLVEPPTRESKIALKAAIAHIHGLRPSGPRHNSTLTEKEANSFENLILLCPNHHSVADQQHETYTVEQLKLWKHEHETRTLRPDLGMRPDRSTLAPSAPYPTGLANEHIERRLDVLRKARFYVEFDAKQDALSLGERLVVGDLSGATSSVRCPALAWCARVLSSTPHYETAQRYLHVARLLHKSPEVTLAAAVLTSDTGDTTAALKRLARIDTPAARSTSLWILAKHQGARAALNWLKATATPPGDLDADAKFALLQACLQAELWADAREMLPRLIQADYECVPALHYTAALVHLILAVPPELRADLLAHPPFSAVSFPLDASPEALAARRSAHDHLLAASEAATQFKCPQAARVADRYALWLELVDPVNTRSGQQRLEQSLREPHPDLYFLALALQFRISVDVHAVEREIGRETALQGEVTADAAVARLSIALAREPSTAAVDYLHRHSSALSKVIDSATLATVDIELLCASGLTQRATEALAEYVENGLAADVAHRLRTSIEGSSGTDPIAPFRTQFDQSNSLRDLSRLVHQLDTHEDWEALVKYADLLFKRTNALSDAERLVRALNNTHDSAGIVTFFDQRSSLLTQNPWFREAYAWALYREGHFPRAQTALDLFHRGRTTSTSRDLAVQLAIASGDWNALLSFVESERSQQADRSARELLMAASLALHVESPHTKELLFAAASAGVDDAQILAGSYMLACRLGVEDCDTVTEWLRRAVALSDRDGPLQSVGIRDILSRHGQWQRLESKTTALLRKSELPLFLAGHQVGQSLAQVTLFPALRNLSESDLRRHQGIPSFSAIRPSLVPSTYSCLGLDATALITLGLLDLLDTVIDAHPTVVIPHSTLHWLFEEKQRAKYHQPRRIREARRLRDLLATRSVDLLSTTATPGQDLSDAMGSDLATLLDHARHASDGQPGTHVVVRPPPVSRVTSFGQEEVDMTEHCDYLVTCSSVLEQLRVRGQITLPEYERSRAYLQLQERDWPDSPPILPNATLYIDNLAVTYFLHLGILDSLERAGLHPVISPYALEEANHLLAHADILARATTVLDKLRGSLCRGISTGKVVVHNTTLESADPEALLHEHPSADCLRLVAVCDALVSDDRCLNAHARLRDAAGEVAVITTVDILQGLRARNRITNHEHAEHRATLRRAGFFFVPFGTEELVHHVLASSIDDTGLHETAELRAIRNQLLYVRLSGWFYFPTDRHWLQSAAATAVSALHSLWQMAPVDGDLVARSNWLVNQLDLRGWYSLFEDRGRRALKEMPGGFLSRLLVPPAEWPESTRRNYWDWLDRSVLTPIRVNEPSLYDHLVDVQRRLISDLADTPIPSSLKEDG